MTLYPNGSLEVINLQLEDTGDYVCEVQIGNKVIKQLHGIEVQCEKNKFKFIKSYCNIIKVNCFFCC